LQSPELALLTPKPKVQLSERSHHWRPSRRQICIRRPRSHPSRTTRNCQNGRALERTRPPCCVGNAAEITQEVTSNSVKPAPPRLNDFRASPPPRVACPPLLPQDASRQCRCKPGPPSTPSATSRRHSSDPAAGCADPAAGASDTPAAGLVAPVLRLPQAKSPTRQSARPAHAARP